MDRNNDYLENDNLIPVKKMLEQKTRKLLEEGEDIIDLEAGDQEMTNPVDVIVKPKAYLKVLFHALKYANSAIPRAQWREVIGLLVGKLNAASTPQSSLTTDSHKPFIVVDAIPVTHGSLVHAEFHDYATLAKRIVNIKSPLFICGWYHSHPGHGIFMSDTDLHTQYRYQKMWIKAIAAVIDPVIVNARSFGWKLFRLTPDFQDWESLTVQHADSFTPQMIPQLIELYAEVLEQDELISEIETRT